MIRPGFRPRALLLSGLLTGCLLLGGIPVKSAPLTVPELPIPKEIYGSYAAKGNCAAEPRVLVNERGLFVQSQGKTNGPFSVDVCFSCAGGARYEGIQTWVFLKSASKMPLVLMFNANEKPGALEINKNDTVPQWGPFLSLLSTPMMQRCEPAAQRAMGPAPANKSIPPAVIPTTNPVAIPALVPNTLNTAGQPAGSPSLQFAGLLSALMAPASLPGNSFYDWRENDRVSKVQWAPLPPEMLDKPTSDGHFFRRRGSTLLGGTQWPVLAAGARTMIMSYHFLNPGTPLGESELVGSLRQSGFTVAAARCPILPGLSVPKWYRLAKDGKRTAFLWVIPANSNRMGREGFTLNLFDYLPPLTPNEKRVYTDRCP